MDKEKKIEIISSLVLIGFFISVVISYVNGYYLKLGYPYNTFLFFPDGRFSDFFSEVKLASTLMPYAEEEGVVKAVYYPFSYLLLYIFSLFGKYSLLLSSTLFTMLFFLFARLYLKPQSINDHKNLFIVVFLSYPFLFEIDRANIEWIVFLSIGAFLYCYWSGKDKIAIIFLSIAVSMKLYPIIFATLFILDKKYTLVLKTVVIVSILTIFSFLIYDGAIADTFNKFLAGQKYFKDDYVLSLNGGMAYNTSIFGLIKGLYVKVSTFFADVQIQRGIEGYAELAKVITTDDMKLLAFVYLIIVLFFYSLLLLFMATRSLEKWEIVTIIVFSMLLFPYVSFDYKLLYVFLPLFYYINSDADKNFLQDLVVVALFAILLVPKNFIFLFSNISISVIVNPLVMISLIMLIIFKNIKTKKVCLDKGQ